MGTAEFERAEQLQQAFRRALGRQDLLRPASIGRRSPCLCPRPKQRALMAMETGSPICVDSGGPFPVDPVHERIFSWCTAPGSGSINRSYPSDQMSSMICPCPISSLLCSPFLGLEKATFPVSNMLKYSLPRRSVGGLTLIPTFSLLCYSPARRFQIAGPTRGRPRRRCRPRRAEGRLRPL
jgi:hypothetical protein